MELWERIQYINKVCGKYKDDLVISIHANYNSSKKLSGVDLFYGSQNGKHLCELYKKYSTNNLIKYRTSYQCNSNNWTNFGIILKVKPIAMLFELGFFSNCFSREIKE